MKREEIMQSIFHEKYSERCEFIATNIYTDWKNNEMDIAAFRKSGYLEEIEIKTSISNFNLDFKKKAKIKNGDETVCVKKHDALRQGMLMPNLFSFALPEKIVDRCRIPDYAGLYIFYPEKKGTKRIHRAKNPKILHERELDLCVRYELATKMLNKLRKTRT